MRHPSLLFLGLIALSAGGCGNPVGPIDVAGVYDLASVGGSGGSEAPVSGRITLTSAGSAERRVTYRLNAGVTPSEFVVTGTYRVVDSLVEFAFLAEGAQSGPVWRPTAKLESGGGLRLSYSGAADGVIVELYTRR